jgi:hypothetical protein
MGDKATNLGGGRGFRPYFGRFAVNLAGDFARSAGSARKCYSNAVACLRRSVISLERFSEVQA